MNRGQAAKRLRELADVGFVNAHDDAQDLREAAALLDNDSQEFIWGDEVMMPTQAVKCLMCPACKRQFVVFGPSPNVYKVGYCPLCGQRRKLVKK